MKARRRLLPCTSTTRVDLLITTLSVEQNSKISFRLPHRITRCVSSSRGGLLVAHAFASDLAGRRTRLTARFSRLFARQPSSEVLRDHSLPIRAHIVFPCFASVVTLNRRSTAGLDSTRFCVASSFLASCCRLFAVSCITRISSPRHSRGLRRFQSLTSLRQFVFISHWSGAKCSSLCHLAALSVPDHRASFAPPLERCKRHDQIPAKIFLQTLQFPCTCGHAQCTENAFAPNNCQNLSFFIWKMQVTHWTPTLEFLHHLLLNKPFRSYRKHIVSV